MKTASWLIALGLLGTTLGAAQVPVEGTGPWTSGNDFVQRCADIDKPTSALTHNEGINVIGCVYWVKGVLEGVNLGAQFDAVGNTLMHEPWAMPDKATTGQAVQVLLKYIRQHPETAHEATVFLMMRALGEVWPAKPQKVSNN